MNVRMGSTLTRQEEMKVISLFLGTKVLRKAFVIHIDWFTNTAPRAMTPPLIEVVKQLIGFKTVTFQIYPHIGPSRTYLTVPWDLRRDPICDLEDDAVTKFNASVAAFRRALEPALGPSMEGSLITRDKLVIFHPREYLSRKKQAAREDLKLLEENEEEEKRKDKQG